MNYKGLAGHRVYRAEGNPAMTVGRIFVTQTEVYTKFETVSQNLEKITVRTTQFAL